MPTETEWDRFLDGEWRDLKEVAKQLGVDCARQTKDLSDHKTDDANSLNEIRSLISGVNTRNVERDRVAANRQAFLTAAMTAILTAMATVGASAWLAPHVAR